MFGIGVCGVPRELVEPERLHRRRVDREGRGDDPSGQLWHRGCHDASPQAQAGLDLISPNVENRVVDVNAVGLGCESGMLVVAGDPDGSYLLDKALDVPTICGLQMPLVGSLLPDEIQILRQWITDLDGSAGGAPDGG